MVVLFWVLYALIGVFILIMWVRLILDFIVSLNRSWRPRGVGLVFAEIAYTITDPPIRLVRRWVPPLRVGGLALDLAWTIVMIVALIAVFLVSGLLY